MMYSQYTLSYFMFPAQLSDPHPEFGRQTISTMQPASQRTDNSAAEIGPNIMRRSMNNRCTFPAPIAAFIIMMAALFFAPATSHAQAIDCGPCDIFTVSVSAKLGCPVTICYSFSGGIELCKTIQPGRRETFPCNVYRAWVVTCHGQYVLIPAAADVRCSPPLTLSAGCCGKICVVPSPNDMCTALEVQPVPCSSDNCP